MFVLILWLTTASSLGITAQEFNSLGACAQAGEKVKEKAPLTVPVVPEVRWVCVEK